MPFIIGTALPYDDPLTYAGVQRFWYRLHKETGAPVQKSLFVWRLERARIAHLEHLFFAPDGPGAHWDAQAPLDPPWGIGNPFSVFRAIPAEARYRFLLENAELITSGVIYGPVCQGQTATYAVKDQFWVFFVDPKADVSVQDPGLGLSTRCCSSIICARSSRIISCCSCRPPTATGSAIPGPRGSALSDCCWSPSPERPSRPRSRPMTRVL
jgi:hypothetical protein